MKNLLLFTTLLELLFSFSQLMAQSPSISSINIDSDSVELYSKLEVAVSGNFTYNNPYDYKEIKLWGEFEAAGGTSVKVDGFYMETFEFSGSNGSIRKSWEDGFYLRFSPNAPGKWRFRVVIEDINGVDSTSWSDFFCIPASGENQKGFIRAGQTNYLNFDDGSSFIPLGHNIAWPDGSVFLNYSDWLTSLKAKGGNYFRLWHCHWGLSLEWLGNGYRGLKKYHQANAFYLDWLHDYCAANGIYTMLCLQHHGQVSTQVNPNWSQNPYNQANGGMCASASAFFTNPAAKEKTKNRLRYIVARWGYNRSIMAWELFNEINWMDDFSLNATDVVDWHEEMAGFLREIDPNNHLITTSLAENSKRDLFWSSPEMDFSQNHDYQSTPRIEQVLAKASQEALLLFDKPTFNSEFGISINGLGLSSMDPDGIHFHNGLWGGFFGGGLGGSASWWWEKYIHSQDLYHHYEGFSAMLGRVPFLDRDYRPKSSHTIGNKGDLSLIPTLGWGELGTRIIEIDKNGQIKGNPKLTAYLYGISWNTQFRSPPMFRVNYPSSPGLLTIRTGATQGKKPRIVVWVDGNKVLDEPGETNTDYFVNIPTGQHTIELDNSGKDWIAIAHYKFSDLGSLLESYVLASSNKDELSAWIFNPKYNHEEMDGNSQPSPVVGSSLVVPDFENGQYLARWYNCLTGTWQGTDSVEVVDNTLVVPIPSMIWDLNLVVNRKLFVSNEEIVPYENIRVYPNPAKAGGKVILSGNYRQRPEELILIDIMGRVVQKWQPGPNNWQNPSFSLDLKTDLPAGSYWLMIPSGKAKRAIQVRISD